MGERYEALLTHLKEIHNLNAAARLLAWDQQTHMPPGGAKARATQIATLRRISHEMLTDDRTARLLQDAAREVGEADYDSDAASVLRLARRSYDLATRLPREFVVEQARLRSLGQQVWQRARSTNDFTAFQPTLERMFELARQEADYLGFDEHPYDALIDRFERGMTRQRIKTIFDGHQPKLIALLNSIREQGKSVDDSVLHQHFDVERQREFALWVIEHFGYDFNRGRQDVAVHPFASGATRDDVRITTRFNEHFLNTALFGMMHESGHAMHRQGGSQALDATPAAAYTLGVGESQSRTWENLVGRSLPFWQWAYPRLQETFPEVFGRVTLDEFYRAINRVAPGFIRVEADEVTYNLHIMLRFELESELLSGQIQVAELPKAWNERFEAYFGIVPPTDTLGVLQDVHWSEGLIGYFPTYALGNMLSVQFFNQAVKEHPTIPDEIASGRFDTLLRWSNEKVHAPGGKFTADELAQRVTGSPLNPNPYMDYLNVKYAEVYRLG